MVTIMVTFIGCGSTMERNLLQGNEKDFVTLIWSVTFWGFWVTLK